MRFDGNMMRNGVKLFATTHYREHNTMCDPIRDMDFYQGYQLRVSNLTLNDFRNALDYWSLTGVISDCLTDPEWRFENLFMET